MKISEHYNLNKSQAELDFVNINTESDTPLFLDPFFLKLRTDNWSIEASNVLRSFFQSVIDNIRNGNEAEAKELFNHLHEPNSTCLGLSRGNPQGKGVGAGDTDKIYDSLLESRAIQTGLIEDIEDNILFVDNFGKDKLSDMTTNILTGELIKYTQNQCNLHNIPLTSNVTSGFFWSRSHNQWINEYTDMLVIQGRKILLIPKGVVSYCKSYTPEKYYNHFILDFLQNENLRISSALVQTRADNETRFVTKKSLKEIHPMSKEFIRRFSLEHPEVLAQFKSETHVESLTNIEISDVSISAIKTTLIDGLLAIPSGRENAEDFHKAIIGILEFIFYPQLINPIKEQEIHEGRKRIDLTFDNAANSGIFHRISENMGIPCGYVPVECKNYSSDINNPELDQLAGRFSVNRGQFGFIVCREIENLDSFISRCRDTYNDGRGLIVPLMDEDLLDILENYNNWNTDYIETFLSTRIRRITLA